ncbi:hypothetical protein [Luteolibacter luteus]|uniref:Uncharacterized protein n=1 Tax=Luteolibacter luteus TaxID=2728835 RepID=A0A858RKI2_9BACT|nr:hypothetical protein [Luteolibacter luteus]QJE97816.1 hypothetical protein HHL09_19185 [Luteolibacter luteus]
MKHALLFLALLATVLPLSAQQAQKPTAVEAAAETPAMRHAEEKEVIAASAALLATSVDLREDGTARTTHQIGRFSNRIEFKGLGIDGIMKAPVTEADRQKGISRRYIALIRCKAHRIWDGPMVEWSEWRESSYGFFPSSIVVEEINGTLSAHAKRLSNFSPGIDSTMAAAR